MELPFAESWKIKMVEPIRKSTREEREQWLKEAKNNVFMLKSEHVYIDCITDSGTGSMSDRQWAAMMMGDESYAGASSFFRLKDTITAITGFEYVIPTHQGRAAENVLFSHLVKQGDIIPGNSHFDTTKGHIESRKATALDCTIDEAKNTQLEIPFKGNVDPKKLEKALAENADKIPFIIVTVTNNTAGGQPVSMQNLREVREVANKYNKPVILDSARFAENAYFIKTREEGYANKTIKEIAKDESLWVSPYESVIESFIKNKSCDEIKSIFSKYKTEEYPYVLVAYKVEYYDDIISAYQYPFDPTSEDVITLKVSYDYILAFSKLVVKRKIANDGIQIIFLPKYSIYKLTLGI